MFPDAHGGAAVHSVAFVGSQLLSAGADGKVRIWDFNGVTGQVRSGEILQEVIPTSARHERHHSSLKQPIRLFRMTWVRN